MLPQRLADDLHGRLIEACSRHRRRLGPSRNAADARILAANGLQVPGPRKLADALRDGLLADAQQLRELADTMRAGQQVLDQVAVGQWVPGWDAALVYSASGLAEQGCVFVTDVPERGRAIWVVTRHEPSRHIGFAVFHAEYVERLGIGLYPALSGARLRWQRSYTALSPTGNELLARDCAQALDARMKRLMFALEHFCRSSGLPPSG